MSERTVKEEDPRVRFAAERTLLAWIRTGLAMMGFGFVVARFGLFLREIAPADRVVGLSRNPILSLWIGTALVVFGMVVNVIAASQHVAVLGRIQRGEPYQAPRLSLGVAAAVGLALFGGAMVVYLVRLVR